MTQKCGKCGDNTNMPYTCNRCKASFCSEHRLPENHECPMLALGPPDAEDIVNDVEKDSSGKVPHSLAELVPSAVEPHLRTLRGNMTYLFLTLIVGVYLAELLVLTLGSRELFTTLFVLNSDNPLYVWTWVTSVFSHSPTSIGHILGNGIVLFFFGQFLEKRIGSLKFAALFVGGGVVAGLAQIVFGYAIGAPVGGVLGASGGAMAVMGAITMIKPDLTVRLYFLIPVPIWVLTLGYAGISVFGAAGAVGNIAHIAHLTGLIIGLGYGRHIREYVTAPDSFRF